MTNSVCDTAWVAMVSKESIYHHGYKKRQILFPQSLQFPLESQREDGSFGAYGSEVDGILNTMADVSAFCKHSVNSAPRGGPMPIFCRALEAIVGGAKRTCMKYR